MSALTIALAILMVAGWHQAFRATRNAMAAHAELVRLRGRVLPETPIYEQMGGVR